MSDSVQMPALGESVTEGTVTRWLKQVGERVEVDEPLLEVSTDKVDTEIPSPVAGVLEQILVGEDETVAVGAALAVIGAGTSAQESAPGYPIPAPAAASPLEQTTHAWPGQPPVPAAPQAPAPAQPAAPAAGLEADGPSAEYQVTMPALGESVTEGTVTRWLKAEGDLVELDEPLLEVSTDKVDTEIPSPVAGILVKVLVGEDETVAVGAPLAVVRSGVMSPAVPTPPVPAPVPPAPVPSVVTTPVPPVPVAPVPVASTAPAHASRPPSPVPPPATVRPAVQTPAGHAFESTPDADGDVSVYVTPLVRRLAIQHGIDLSGLGGTGVGGRIRKQDVLEAARARREAELLAAAQNAQGRVPTTVTPTPVAASPLRGTTQKLSRLRRLIGLRMVESLQVSAQLTTVVEVDVTKVARLRARAKADFEAREGVKLSFLPFFARAAVEALKQYPVVNASIEEDSIVYHGEENLGVAVDTERGLVVPIVRDAGDLNIAGLARKIADLADRTRRNKISPDELGGGTFTLTNTGSRGALFDTPIVYQPQVAILGTGAVVKRPVVVPDRDGGETIAIRSMVYLALSYDHRIVDGADAARFLVAVKSRLEEGAFEAELGL